MLSGALTLPCCGLAVAEYNRLEAQRLRARTDLMVTWRREYGKDCTYPFLHILYVREQGCLAAVS
jgi:hypothetical protein